MSAFAKELVRFLLSVAVFVLFLIIFFVPILLLNVGFQLIGCRTWVTKDEVYDILSFTEWKSGIEIDEEIRQRRRKEQRFTAMLGSVYPALHDLRDEGLAEYRERQLDEELLKIRNNIPKHEYRRKPGGSLTPKKERRWFTLPIPVPSWKNARNASSAR